MTTTQRPAPMVMPDLPPQIAMLQMIGGLRVSRIIYAAAALGVADFVAESPKTAAELAEATGTHAGALYRVLRALAGLEIFSEDHEGRFHLTPTGSFLRCDTPDALGSMIKVLGESWHWEVWGRLLETVQTGKAAFEQIYGMESYDYWLKNPDLARPQGASKTSVSARASAALLENYDFSNLYRVVEIAVIGGYGNTLIPLLKQYPTLRGVMYDLPFIIEDARPVLQASGIGDRVELYTGHCLESVPPDGDAYLLMFVLHNWDDLRAIKILKNCHQAMVSNGKVLLVEMLMPAGNAPFAGKFVDLESMLTTPGGYERTEAQYRSLLAGAGFQVTRVIPTQTANSIIEAVSA